MYNDQVKGLGSPLSNFPPSVLHHLPFPASINDYWTCWMNFSTSASEKEHFVAVFLSICFIYCNVCYSTHFAANDSMTFCYPSLTLPTMFFFWDRALLMQPRLATGYQSPCTYLMSDRYTLLWVFRIHLLFHCVLFHSFYALSIHL